MSSRSLNLRAQKDGILVLFPNSSLVNVSNILTISPRFRASLQEPVIVGIPVMIKYSAVKSITFFRQICRRECFSDG